MSRKLHLLVPFGLASLLSACSAPSESGDPSALTNPVAGDPDAIARGSAIYQLQCRACHADIQQGGAGPALAGIIPRSSDGRLVRVIENGTSGMPSFGDALSRDEVWDLVSYLRDEAPAE